MARGCGGGGVPMVVRRASLKIIGLPVGVSKKIGNLGGRVKCGEPEIRRKAREGKRVRALVWESKPQNNSE